MPGVGVPLGVPRAPGGEVTAAHHVLSVPRGGTAAARHSLTARRAKLSSRSDPDGSVRQEVAELDAALARLDGGTWGRCERCGGAIGRDRLRAVPEARFCVPCSRK